MSRQTNMPARIFLVEDHPDMRRQLVAMIDRASDLAVCGEADDAGIALNQIVQILPDLVLLDLSLKNSSGFDLLADLQALYPDLPVLVLSMHDASVFAKRVLASGAKGYISKQTAIHHLLEAIRTVWSGRTYTGELVTAPGSFSTPTALVAKV